MDATKRFEWLPGALIVTLRFSAWDDLVDYPLTSTVSYALEFRVEIPSSETAASSLLATYPHPG